METKNSTTFGNVTFTETGISYEVPYKEPNWEELPHSNFKVLMGLKELVKGRLQSCINNLNNNIANNVGCTVNGIVFFKDGSHFSRPAAEAMQRILECQHIHSFDAIMFDQAIKACVTPKVVRDNIVVSATFTESQLQLIIGVLIEGQIVYHQCKERACTAGMEEEFNFSLKKGFSPNEILKEWDL